MPQPAAPVRSRLQARPVTLTIVSVFALSLLIACQDSPLTTVGPQARSSLAIDSGSWGQLDSTRTFADTDTIGVSSSGLSSNLITDGVLLSSLATSTDLVLNGGFEQGFLGWGRSVIGYGINGNPNEALIAAEYDPFSPKYYAFPVTHSERIARSGKLGASAVQNGSSVQRLYQFIALPAVKPAERITLRYWMRWKNFFRPHDPWAAGYQDIAVTLRDSKTGNILAELTRASASNFPSFSGGGDAQQANYQEFSADITAFAGRSVLLYFEHSAIGYYQFTDIDDVSITVGVANTPPSIVVPERITVRESVPFVIHAEASDPDPDNHLTFEWDFDGDGRPDATEAAPSWSYPDNGTNTASVIVSDGYESVSASILVDVVNVAPEARASFPDRPVPEGSGFDLHLSDAVDVPDDLASMVYSFDCADGRGFQDVQGQSTRCRAPDDGTLAVRARVTDKDGGLSEYRGTVVIENVAPVLTSLTGPDAPVAAGGTVTVSASFTDAGLDDTHTGRVTWDLGGQATSTGVSISGGMITAAAALSPGVYTVTLEVSDDDGGKGSLTATSYVVVYDPSGGFVSGGGWIMSPAAACDPQTCLDNGTGKAHFGFVSKYRPGAATPTGNTEFNFQTGRLLFRSTIYEWLVVAGARAQYKGEGTVNGSGKYRFLLTAIDADVPGGPSADSFRLKVWSINNDGSDGGVIYDNARGSHDDSDASTALGGGSITIHKQ